MRQYLSFLTHLYNRNLSYSAINTAKSAVSMSVYIVNNIHLGDHILVKQFMKGIANSRPSLPRYNCTWDVKKVLEYLETLYPLDQLSLKMVSYKLITLLALCTGQRMQTLHAIQLKNMDITQSYLKIRIGQLLKQSRPGKHLAEIYIEKYSKESLCVISTMLYYIDITKNFRSVLDDGLFLGVQKPYKSVTKGTLAKWIKRTLLLAGIDMNVFCPHSTRSASTSAAVGRVPIETILRTAGWTKDCTFRKFYKRPITNSSAFSDAILGLAE